MTRLMEAHRFAEILGAERAGTVSADDIAQEAWVTAWEVLSARPDAPREYLIAAMKNRANGVAGGRKLTGAPSHQGRANIEADSLDLELELGYEAATRDAFEEIDGAYHRGDVVRALNRLSPRHREYVVLRFWGQWTAGELEPVIGVKATNQARMWNDTIRPALAEELAHLADVREGLGG